MKTRSLTWLVALLPVGALVVCAAAAPPGKVVKKATAPSFEKDVLPLVQKYCVSCHTGDMPSAGVSLSEYKTGAAALKARNLWERVATAVASNHMPPKGMPEPTQAERTTLVNYLQSAISKADCNIKQPGRVTMRRLNRAEYNNTVRDLLNVDIRPADEFPSDDVGYGFDNIGDVLSISPLLLEKYLTAARKVAKAAIIAPEDQTPINRRYSASQLSGDGGSDSNGVRLMSVGETGANYDFNGQGTWRIKVRAFEEHAGPDAAQMAIKVDGKEVARVPVHARRNKPQVYETVVNIEEAGRKRVVAMFMNDYYDPKNEDEKLRGDRNLVVQDMEIVPEKVTPMYVKPPLSHRRLMVATPAANTEAAKEAATRKILGGFAPRAYRRPVTADEIEKLARVAALTRKAGGSFEKGVQAAVQAALVSPNFLFLVETEAPGKGGKRALTDFELASRLSYFLWSSLPDDRLFTLAKQGKLQNPVVLKAEARRMLQDPKAKALADNFAGQWLQLRKINYVQPDPQKYPVFNDSLRAAMRTETEMYFNYIVQQDQSVLEFLDSNYTFLNETLAKHYGNSEIKGESFQKVALKGKERGGILTQASVLTVTSHPNRTSPVKRGKYILENILGTPIPPAPPNVPQLADDKKEPLTGTLRERMEKHRSDPACASCHQRMDPIGFGFENYDAIGAWRTMDGSDRVDASGKLPDGATFAGSEGLRKYLLAKKGMFVRTLTERLLTYGLGRGVEPYDNCNLDAMAVQVAQSGYKFSAVVNAVITSEPFRYKTVEKPAKAKVAQR